MQIDFGFLVHHTLIPDNNITNFKFDIKVEVIVIDIKTERYTCSPNTRAVIKHMTIIFT